MSDARIPPLPGDPVRRGSASHGGGALTKAAGRAPAARDRTHVFIIDGTMSRLEPGHETNAGLLFRLLTDLGPRRDQTLGYHPGIQGSGTAKWLNIAAGVGINLSIAEGYAALCSRYRPGDRIMLFGFSRGAYAVRSLAGFLGRVGLLRREDATERLVAQAFRHYQNPTLTSYGRLFRRKHCHANPPIEVLGVWDTVRALGLPYPALTRLAPMATDFHDDNLSPNVLNAFHALALDEDRAAFRPVTWHVAPGWQGRVEQMWFAGAHGDVGGNVWTKPEARPLANISLVWMVRRAVDCGLIVPDGWEARFPVDCAAPAKGSRHGSARLFWNRAARVVGTASGEAIHATVGHRLKVVPGYRPRGIYRGPDQDKVAAALRSASPRAAPGWQDGAASLKAG